jgi:membrane protein
MPNKVKSKNFLQRSVDKLDAFQQRHKTLAVPYAIAKKYSDDEAGYQAALMAYYGFLSLFPLLIVATTIIQRVTFDNTMARQEFLSSATSYFPAIGDNLAASINTPSKSGLALVIALLITLYGARGVANAVQHALNHVWCVPRGKRVGFPRSTLRSFVLIFTAGGGLVASAAMISFATAADHVWPLRAILGAGGFAVLFLVFWGVFTYGTSGRWRPLANVPGAVLAAVGLLVLQALGSYIVAHQLKTQTGLNAQFGVIIALLFWLYLQAVVFLYAVELNTVRAHKLWPRSITPEPPLRADKKAYALYQKRETFHPDEPIHH